MQQHTAAAAYDAAIPLGGGGVAQRLLAIGGGLCTAGTLQHNDFRFGAGGGGVTDDLTVVVSVRNCFALGLAAAAAGVNHLIALLAAAVPVVTQGGNVFFDDLAADAALVFGTARRQAGGGHFGVAHFHIIVLVGVSLEMGGQHHAAGIGVGWHGELDGGAAVAAAGTGGPSRKDEAFIRYRGHGAGRTALLDQLAGGTGERAAVGSYKLQGHFGAAHGDGILCDQVGRHAVRGGNVAQRLRTAVFRNISMGAHIIEVCRDRRFGKMHAIRQSVVSFGPTGGAVAQYFGAVQKLESVFLTHFDQGGVVGIHLGHGQVGIFPLLVQRRNRADDDVTVRPGGLNGFQSR